MKREESIKQAREQLPIIAEEAHIMESINNNNVIIICGETGCGKTTQVPQFLYEAGMLSVGYVDDDDDDRFCQQ